MIDGWSKQLLARQNPSPQPSPLLKAYCTTVFCSFVTYVSS
jgi:hypothetical protein